MLVRPFTIGQQNEVTHAYETEAAHPPEKQPENRPPYVAQAMNCFAEKNIENRPAYVAQSLQYPTARYPEDCYDVRKAVAMEQIKTNGEIVRAAEKERVRLRGAELRSLQREEERERKKAEYKELQILESGELYLVTKNLRIQPKPQMVTNMRAPSLTVLKRARNETEKIFRIDFFRENKKEKIFLDANFVGKGSYLIQKFTAVGVTFMLPSASQKNIVIQLVCMLLTSCSEEKLLPEVPGWMRMSDGRYTFVEQEDSTWKYAKQMCR